MAFRRLFLLAALVALVALAAGPAAALAHGHKTVDKRAILLVSFGTSVPRAQAVYAKVQKAYAKAFPGVELRWAYTSGIVRRIVAKKQGKHWLSPEEALAKLMTQGYTKVAVQSLHVIPGEEYHDLVRTVQGFDLMSYHFKALIGRPLCATTDDLRAVARIMAQNLPQGRAKNQAVVFMGHGTSHPAGVVYPAMAFLLQRIDPLLIMGTVEGYPTLNDVVAALKANGVKKAYLLPFMTVAGDHAMNDMAGPEPDSWKSVLTKNGIQAEPVLRAITDIPAVVDIFVAHTKVCYAHFK